jgi:hypothetical protein
MDINVDGLATASPFGRVTSAAGSGGKHHVCGSSETFSKPDCSPSKTASLRTLLITFFPRPNYTPRLISLVEGLFFFDFDLGVAPVAFLLVCSKFRNLFS